MPNYWSYFLTLLHWIIEEQLTLEFFWWSKRILKWKPSCTHFLPTGTRSNAVFMDDILHCLCTRTLILWKSQVVVWPKVQHPLFLASQSKQTTKAVRSIVTIHSSINNAGNILIQMNMSPIKRCNWRAAGTK